MADLRDENPDALDAGESTSELLEHPEHQALDTGENSKQENEEGEVPKKDDGVVLTADLTDLEAIDGDNQGENGQLEKNDDQETGDDLRLNTQPNTPVPSSSASPVTTETLNINKPEGSRSTDPPKWEEGLAKVTLWKADRWRQYFKDSAEDPDKPIEYISDSPEDAPFTAPGEATELHKVRRFADAAATELHKAADLGWDDDVVKGLLGVGFHIEAKDELGKTPIYYAAKAGHANTVKLLANNHADIESETEGGWRPLNAAARAGHDEVIEVLLNFNTKIDTKTKAGCTALYHAAYNRKVSSVKILLDHGAKQWSQDTDGDTELHVAVGWVENEEIVKMLLEYVYNDESPTDEYKPQAIDTEDEKIIQKRRKMMTARNKIGETVLDKAVAEGNGAITTLLLKAFEPKLKVPAYTEQHIWYGGYGLVEDWLYLAASEGRYESVNWILGTDWVFDLNRYKNGETMLHAAASKGSVEVVQRLLESGAEIDVKSKPKGRTALHNAARHDRKEVAKLLLKRGANFGITNTQGLTALDLAKRYKAREAETVLLNPPIVSGAFSAHEEALEPPQPSNSEEDVCQGFDAFIVGFYSRKVPNNLTSQTNGGVINERVDWLPRIKSVHEVIHDPGPKAILEDAISNEDGQKHSYLFRWIHLPANNIVWVEALLRTICREKRFSSPEFKDLSKFVFKEGNEHKGSKIHSRYMKTGCHVLRDNMNGPKRPGGKQSQNTLTGGIESKNKEKEKIEETKENEVDGIQVESGEVKEEDQAAAVPDENLEPAKETKPRPDGVQSRYDQGKLAIYMPFLDFERKDSLNSFRDAISGIKSNATGTHLGTAQRKKSQNPARVNISRHDSVDTENESDGEGQHGKAKDSKKSQDEGLRSLSSSRRSSIASFSESNFQEEKKKCDALIQEYLNHKSGHHLHLPRTLYQYYYQSIDTESRDEDQVVYRFCKEYDPTEGIEEQPQALGSVTGDPSLFGHGRLPVDRSNAAHELHRGSVNPITDLGNSNHEATSPEKDQDSLPSKNPKLFMVDQLWLWITDENTIITSFPQRWASEEYRDTKVLECIQTHLADKTRPQVKSVYEMAALLTSCCVKFADQCRVTGTGIDENFLQVFAEAISKVADRETKLFRKFTERLEKHAESKEESQGDILSTDSNAREPKPVNSEFSAPKTQPGGHMTIGNPKGAESNLNLPEREQLGVANLPLTHNPNARTVRTTSATAASPITKNNSSVSIKVKNFVANLYAMFKESQGIGVQESDKGTARGQKPPETGIKPGEDTNEKLAEANKDADISGEIKVLKDIRIIKDELAILQKLFNEQNDVASTLFSGNKKLVLVENTSVMDYYSKRSGLENRIRDVKKMDQDADKVYRLVTTLLDLRQKQANIDLAEKATAQQELATQLLELAGQEQKSTSDHLAIAHDEQHEVLKQGRTLLVFTFVTIIFLPMSFLASLFALNVASFPHESGALAYESKWIFSRIIGIPIALGVLFAIALRLITIGQIMKWLAGAKDIFKKRLKRAEKETDPDGPHAPPNTPSNESPIEALPAKEASNPPKTELQKKDPSAEDAPQHPDHGQRVFFSKPTSHSIDQSSNIGPDQQDSDKKSPDMFSHDVTSPGSIDQDDPLLVHNPTPPGMFSWVKHIPLFHSLKVQNPPV